jgi:sulfite reductase (NADPH) flavoprotein alpha-component
MSFFTTNLTSEIKKIDRTTPFSAQLIERLPLTKAGSSKETFHLTLDIAGSGLTFKVGDSLGIYGQNCPLLVDRILKALHASGDESIIDPKSQVLTSLRHFLTQRANIGRSNTALLQLLCRQKISAEVREHLDTLVQPGHEEALKTFLQQHDPLDLLHLCAIEKLSLQEFCNQLSPLLPRFYSIASSQKHAPDRVDITVALSSYLHGQEQRFGVASYFLSHLAQEKATPIPLYVQPTPHFTLPHDPQTPIIMIGPGTGVAPFRGFMQERMVTASPGKNWLFFGERNRATDFFYEDYWLDLHRQNALQLDLAFSRDQADKIYVQHRLLDQQAALWSWLQEGAAIYVCGEAEKMAKAVEGAWLEIFQRQGNMSLENAKIHLRALKKEKRYLADVY